MSISPPGPLSYTGKVAIPWITRTFPPTSDNWDFDVPSIWIDTESGLAYILTQKPNRVANWQLITCCATASGLLSLTGTDGVTVEGDSSNNITLLATNATITGDIANSTLTFTAQNALTWYSINANTALAINSGYFCIGGTNIQLALPTTSIRGDTIEISLDGATRFVVTQAAGQQIRYGDKVTTLGAGGTLASTAQGDSITLKCQTANTLWNVVDSIGNLDVT